MPAKKYYVIWEGHQPGIYESWDEAEKQIKGYKGALFRSFKSETEAERAFKNPGSVAPAKKKKINYYVVWMGHTPGIYTDWKEASRQIIGAEKPIYKTFGSKELAQKAYEEGPEGYLKGNYKKTRDLTDAEKKRIGTPIELSLCVDAACNAKTGLFEYQGVWTYSGDQTFHAGPFNKGTNNIGEFLALVHALAFLKKLKLDDFPIYSDSKIAMSWIRKKRINTKSDDPETQTVMNRGLRWLHSNSFNNPILKWETKAWGEIPADFGRK